MAEQSPAVSGRLPSFSAIIPTKNRPEDLSLTVRTLLEQTVLPEELIVVDQSESSVSALLVESLFEVSAPLMKLRYIHDPMISGAAVARNVAIDQSHGNILLFLDDDVEMEKDFIAQLLNTYQAYPAVAGVSGVITNYRSPSVAMHLWKQVFLRGPFRDERELFHLQATRGHDRNIERISRFSGSLMSFRASAVGSVRFDNGLRGASDGEDVDFCMQLGPDAVLLVNPRARLAHHMSLSGRTSDHWLRKVFRGQIYIYQRHWNTGIKNKLCLCWFLTGAAIIATASAACKGSLRAWRSLLLGYKDGVAAAMQGSATTSKHRESARL